MKAGFCHGVSRCYLYYAVVKSLVRSFVLYSDTGLHRDATLTPEPESKQSTSYV